MHNNKHLFVALICLLACLMAAGVYHYTIDYQKQAMHSNKHKKMSVSTILLVGSLVLSCAKYGLALLLMGSKHAQELTMDFLFRFPSFRRAVLTMAKYIKKKFPEDFTKFFQCSYRCRALSF